ncbi:MAG: hypothetical protein ACK4N5_25665, partial [Myxococcales bacterium]
FDRAGRGRPETLALYNGSDTAVTGALCPPTSLVIFASGSDGLRFERCVATALPAATSVRLFAGRFDYSSPGQTVGFLLPLEGAPAWFGHFAVNRTSGALTFPPTDRRNPAIPVATELVAAADLDGDGFDEVVLQTNERPARVLLARHFCLDADTCALSNDVPLVQRTLEGFAGRPSVFVGALGDRPELLVGTPGMAELRTFRYAASALVPARPLPTLRRLGVDFDVLAVDLDTDDRADLVVAGDEVTVQLGDGRGGLSPGDRWRVPGSSALTPLPVAGLAVVSGRDVELLGARHGQLHFADRAPLLRRPSPHAFATLAGEVLLLAGEELTVASASREAGAPRLVLRAGTSPAVGALTYPWPGAGAFPLVAANP